MKISYPIHLLIYVNKILKPKDNKNDSLESRPGLTHGNPLRSDRGRSSGPAKMKARPHSSPQTTAAVGGFRSGLLPGGGLPLPGGRWEMISQFSSSLKGHREGLETA